MKEIYSYVIVLLVLLESCGGTKETNHPDQQQVLDTLSLSAENRLTSTEPNASTEAEFIEIDTLVSNGSLRILISFKNLDTYVNQEYATSEGEKVDSYRDIARNIQIFKDGEVVADTVIKKQSFGTFLDEDFMVNAIFRNYWIDSFDANSVTFFGTISKPDTDWAFPFFHIYSFESKQFTVERLEEEEI